MNKPAQPLSPAEGSSPDSVPSHSLPSGAEILSIEEIVQTPLFGDVPEKPIRAVLQRFKKNWDHQPPIWKRTFKKGELICVEGDYDQTAFYILEGKVKIFIEAQLGALRSAERKGKGLFGKLKRFTTDFVRTGKQEGRSDDTETRTIPIDAPVDLEVERPFATLGQGDLFGEQTCINFLPRSATVEATEDCVCLEMLAPILRAIKDHSPRLIEEYKNRAFQTHVWNVPVFQEDREGVYDYLKDRIELLTKNRGEVVFKEGDPAEDFYLIRSGFIRVSQHKAGGDTVLRYLGRGDHFGHLGILDSQPRNATCAALNTTELVKVSRQDFMGLLEKFPNVKKRFHRESAKYRAVSDALAQRTQTFAIRNFLDQGLMEANNLLLLDLEKCTRCDECVKACADSHDGVTRLNRVGLRFDKYLVATSCRSCSDPVCLPVCPVGSIRRRDSLEIVIEDWCIGCSKCADACPYGNINMHEMIPEKGAADDEGEDSAKKKARVQTKAITCDLCSGVGGEPMCVYACPHDAAHRVPRNQFADYFPTIFDQSQFTLSSPTTLPPRSGK
jgi:CRP-like cAMP-binding protein